MGKRRVVVTGIGVITSNASGIQEFSKSLRIGQSGFKRVKLFDPSPYKFDLIGEVDNIKNRNTVMDRASQLAMIAAREAVVDADREWIMEKRTRCGVVLGTTCGGITSHEIVIKKWQDNQPVSSDEINEVPFHTMAQHIAGKYRLEGPVATVTIACASGLNAVGFATDLIRNRQADIMLAGGSDTVSLFTFSGFSVLKSMAKDTCRPFDNNRTGIVLGEGAGIIVLESLDEAMKRGAKIYAEILGYGFCNDAYHSTAPDPEGWGMVRSIQQALHKSGIGFEDIDYINAHGTGTRANDVMECNAYKRVFGDRAYRIPISSTKSMIGHTLGASGAIELIATILSIDGQFVPPTVNYSTFDPECDLDVVPNRGRPANLHYALCCNAGFAGNNTALIVGIIGDKETYGGA